MKHVNESVAHKIALQLEKGKPIAEQKDQENSMFLGDGPSQLRVDHLQEAATNEAYKKMIRTAYELTLHPNLPISNFEVLIKCQRMHGVTLISGKDNKAAGEYIECISKAVNEKVAAILASKHAMSLLSDGSQARKTGSDKGIISVIKNEIFYHLDSSIYTKVYKEQWYFARNQQYRDRIT